jgi:multidrug resistance efflux pump
MNLITIKSRLPIIAGGGILGLGVVAVLVIWVIPLIAGGSLSAPRAAPAEKYVAKRDTLTVKVTESGTLKALKQEDIKCKAPGTRTIKYIVPEGKQITEENVRAGRAFLESLAKALRDGTRLPEITAQDVQDGKVLVQLDRKDLVDKRDQQKLSVTNAENAYYQAQGNLTIQLKQNDSDIKAGQLNVKFARMDLEKYLSAQLAGGILAQRQRITQSQPEPARPDQAQPAQSAPRQSVGGNQSQEPAPAAPEVKTDFLALVNNPDLGGEALQQKRALESDISLSKEELTRAQNKLNSTIDLVNKGYVARDEQVADELALKQSQVGLERAETALELFLRYQFVKDAEKLLSDYVEAESELDRIFVRTDSKKSLATTDLKSKESAMIEERRQFDDLSDQIMMCAIVSTQDSSEAPGTGTVVYAGGNDMFRRNPIGEGESVREGQSLITLLPDSSEMAVSVKVNESNVKKVQAGQRAIIKVEAFADETLYGAVTKVSPVPDSQSSFINPDQKVYSTEVLIDGTYPQLKPGMTAEVQIIAEVIEGAVVVPVSAVYVHDEEKETVCYVIKDDRYECRPVLVGSANDSFIEIKKGLDEGETVLLREPLANAERVVYVKASFTKPAPAAAPPAAAAIAETKPSEQPEQQNPGTGDRQGGGRGRLNGQNTQDQNQTPGADQAPAENEKPAAAQQPSGDGQPEMTDEEKAAAMKKAGEIMARFTEEEKGQIFQAVGGQDEFRALFEKLLKMSVDEAEKYLRDNYLNK